MQEKEPNREVCGEMKERREKIPVCTLNAIARNFGIAVLARCTKKAFVALATQPTECGAMITCAHQRVARSITTMRARQKRLTA